MKLEDLQRTQRKGDKGLGVEPRLFVDEVSVLLTEPPICNDGLESRFRQCSKPLEEES